MQAVVIDQYGGPEELHMSTSPRNAVLLWPLPF